MPHREASSARGGNRGERRAERLRGDGGGRFRFEPGMDRDAVNKEDEVL